MRKLFRFILLILIASSIGAQGKNESRLDMKWFGQKETWGSGYLGDSEVIKIRTHGCALTASAMVLNHYEIKTNPEKLNKWLLKNDGFDKGWDDDSGEYLGRVRVIWHTMADGYDEIKEYKRYDFKAEAADLDLIRRYLDQKIPVIAEVLRPKGIPHFVVLTGYTEEDFYMMDPLDEKTLLLSETYNISDKYGSGPARNIFGIRIFIPED